MQYPNFITDQHLEVLAKADQSIIENMFLAIPYILKHFPGLTPSQAQEVLLFWVNKQESLNGQEVKLPNYKVIL